MKRTLAGLALAAALSTNIGAAHAGTYDAPLDRACRYQYVDGKAGWSVTEVRYTINCATRRFRVGRVTAFDVARRESGFYYLADNPWSSAQGVYQIVDGTWAGMFPAWDKGYRFLGHSKFNARTNVMVAVHYAGNHGWGPWSY